MRQQQFAAEQEHLWAQYRALLEQLDKPARRRDANKIPLSRFPRLYRRICADYALARSRRYSPGLTEDLHDLVSRGYAHLYRRRPTGQPKAWTFWSRDSPSHCGVTGACSRFQRCFSSRPCWAWRWAATRTSS